MLIIDRKTVWKSLNERWGAAVCVTVGIGVFLWRCMNQIDDSVDSGAAFFYHCFFLFNSLSVPVKSKVDIFVVVQFLAIFDWEKVWIVVFIYISVPVPLLVPFCFCFFFLFFFLFLFSIIVVIIITIIIIIIIIGIVYLTDSLRLDRWLLLLFLFCLFCFVLVWFFFGLGVWFGFLLLLLIVVITQTANYFTVAVHFERAKTWKKNTPSLKFHQKKKVFYCTVAYTFLPLPVLRSKMSISLSFRRIARIAGAKSFSRGISSTG